MTMYIELSPELEKRVKAWSIEFNEPAESLAVDLLREYFDDSDTGAEISAAVKAGQMELYGTVAD
ncbi:MAG: hypothetical protein IJ587_07790 [Synergistaceae bacterium]|nr:hypothetical protein [Synergistaceae bacterium]